MIAELQERLAPGLRLAGRAHHEGREIFPALTFTADPGAWTCLLGPSGVGKSTILRLLAGLETGVAFDGTCGAEDGAPLAGRVALMAQSDLLLPWATVEENVLVGARLRGARPDRARAQDVLTRVGLGTRGNSRPGALSGGERQRVALARTLMEDRPVVLLDEPFSALDAKRRSEMQDLAAELLAGRTVLMVTHDPSEAARLGQRIWIMGQDGLTDAPCPDGPPPRPVDDPATVTAAAALLARLRATE